MDIIKKLGITPGPWEITGYFDHLIGVDKTCHQAGIVAELWPNAFTRKYNNVDARLIAAAPEMLKALITAGNQFREYALEHTKKGKHEKATTNYRMSDICIDAVTKATGKTWDEIKELME